ncbi:carbamoyl-phosphate synthase (glutamine-hydrolyzing) large subunit [Tepidibacillus sp. HK-1]|uniref:carbamoyl-phosphate synthase (glutamine-hydrolyzing) large subunit n=1 Tax=Tepidibacillus sp. HK-1 TaxID=1883407 RepID=UPI0008530CC2|nr:carbamoyl-phosphate synthase (glutamine-hydrolyzing) large subunit [Tepidibacillus sp. HK-1]GBF10585.1 carbamoyl-phosphate synthase arginine-specific large chain [Tepidibacillus sp. HK-1]
MPKSRKNYRKILVIGSGPIVIGQAAEFDYAGTQACMALKEEGIEIVLVNNNPATIMTDQEIADYVYFEPLSVESVTKIIERERPDGLLATLGGQTGLNLAIELEKAGVLTKYQVPLLGTTITSIQKGEDRELFKQTMEKIGEPIPESIITGDVEEAVNFAKEIGFPVIVRPAYTLGGTGGGKAETEEELRKVATSGIEESPIHQIQVDKSLLGWKEIEYEVMRDQEGNSIIVCNMENIDPMGIHTGDSIVIAPSQTLNDREYQMLRTVSLKVIETLEIIGGCNIQFALHPDGEQYYIIEVNPRVSRSSALASKASGYPIARIATKLALGYSLYEIKNPITQHTYASFEPALDYVVIKFPRWPFDKFPYIHRQLGTQMKATGEVMTIDRTFEGAFYKAIRALEIGKVGLLDETYVTWSDEQLEKGITQADDQRIFLIAEAFHRGISMQTIHRWSNIHPFFLHKFKKMVEMELEINDWKKNQVEVNLERLKTLKRKGISDQLLAKGINLSDAELWSLWKQQNILPSYKSVDTCAGEFEAKTPYFYSSRLGTDDESPLQGKKVAVIGSGPIRIGQGIEFDYCAVHTALTLEQEGIQSIMINDNPETVSTDYHMSSRLYMEPLTLEDVLPILEKEQVDGVVYQVGGQTGLKLAKQLEPYFPLLGTPIATIDQMEDREQFNQFLFHAGIEPIPGQIVWKMEELLPAVTEIGYPILIRPSYVIGGQWMRVIENQQELEHYLDQLTFSLSDQSFYPLLIDRYISGKEVEVDAVSDGEDWIIPAIMEHLEPAGIHSGDSTAVLPPFSLTTIQKKKVIEAAEKVLKHGNFIGLVNIQMIVDGNHIYVLEVNPRASRTIPVISKVTGIPMIQIATQVQLGKCLKQLPYPLGVLPENPFYTVKAPVFSNRKLPGLTDLLGPEMKSTGEILSLGWTLEEALAKVSSNPDSRFLQPRTLTEYRTKGTMRGEELYEYRQNRRSTTF